MKTKRRSRKGIKLGPRRRKIVRDLIDAMVDELWRLFRPKRSRAWG